MTTVSAPAPAVAAHHHHHQNDSAHRHDGPVESYAHVQGGPTVLDIGGDIGAMIVTMNAETAGTELHLRSEHEPPIAIHTSVWRRGFGERVSTTAVFAELVEGRYWVLDSSGNDLRQVEIRGGALTSIDLTD
jgi:hypothetical protein